MLESLAPRERQIVDLLYVQPEATVAEVRAGLPVRLTEQAVRAMLRRLEDKGVVRRQDSERGLLFSPVMAKAEVKSTVLRRLVDVLFDGSPVGAASALLGMTDKLDEHQLDELERMIASARQSKRG
jgi:predicted transcriptional regulator